MLIDNDAKASTGTAQRGNDGNDIQGIDRIESYTLNVKGQAIQIDYDNDADGTLDKSEHIVLNANGNWVEKYIDSDGKESTGETKTINGKDVTGIDKVETYGLNAKGQTVQTNYDNDANGTVDQIDYVVLDANGNSLEKHTDTDAKASTGNTKTINGKDVAGIDKSETYVVNSKGQNIQTSYDNDADGTPERVEYYVLNSNGNWLEKYTNTDASDSTGYAKTINGKEVLGIDSIETYYLNGKGQSIKTSYDNNADGVVDSIDYIELDANGAWLTKYTDSDPNNASGNTGNNIEISGALADALNTDTLSGINDIVYYIRDAQGRMIGDKQDQGADGTINYARHIELYPNGNWKYTNVNADGDEATGSTVLVNGIEVAGIDRRELVYADSRGYTIGRHWDDDMDGNFDRFQKVVVNTNGNWVELHTDSNNDGSYERSEFYTLDQYGRTSGITYVVYSQQVETLKALSDITSEDGRVSSNSYIRDVNGNVLITGNDANVKDGLIDTLSFSARNYEVDISDLLGSNVFALGEIDKSLARITLSNTTAETNITLNSATLAQISKTATLDIRGDATDTVKLSNDFTKVDGTTKRAGSDVLQAYTAQVDGETYTLYIDTDIDTIIG